MFIVKGKGNLYWLLEYRGGAPTHRSSFEYVTTLPEWMVRAYGLSVEMIT